MSEIGCIVTVHDWYMGNRHSEKLRELKDGTSEVFMPKVNGVTAHCKIVPKHNESEFIVKNNRGEIVLRGKKKHEREWTRIGDLKNRIDTAQFVYHKAEAQGINISPMVVSDGARRLEIDEYIETLAKEIISAEDAQNGD